MFHVPEEYRLPGKGGDPSYGNNGVFEIPAERGHNWRFFIIASDGEDWRPIKGYERLYEVSNTGRVRALEKSVDMPNGATRNHPLHDVALERMECGYLRASLCTEGKIDKRLVHVLVAEAFIANPNHYDTINHIDGVKSNNLVTNLEWCTQAWNHHHAIENGLASGMTMAQIDEIRRWIQDGYTNIEIAERVGRSRQRIADIRAGRVRSADLPKPNGYADVNGFWEHVSAHLFLGRHAKKTPTWHEMCFLKDLFWDEEDVVIQYHPRKSEYVNQHPHVLHLWRPMGAELPTPPSILVGFRA